MYNDCYEREISRFVCNIKIGFSTVVVVSYSELGVAIVTTGGGGGEAEGSSPGKDLYQFVSAMILFQFC